MTVTRTAQLSRKTGETDVALTLGLSGTGAGTRSTGVGFFDHMLDLLARHGKLDLDVTVTGDLQTGSHHTVEEVRKEVGNLPTCPASAEEPPRRDSPSSARSATWSGPASSTPRPWPSSGRSSAGASPTA